MTVNSYDRIQSSLLAGDIDACRVFLDSRHESDRGSVDYWYWLTQMYYRSGRFLQALDTCFKLSREAGAFGRHFHCLADICAHLGVKDMGLSGLEMLASKPELDSESSYYVRLCGYHYLGEDEAVLRVQRESSVPAACMNEHYRARSIMRSQGIAAGIDAFHQTYCNRQAVSELWPDQDIDSYWCGQRELPRQLIVRLFSCGWGDFIQWIRYARALQALGVLISWDGRLDGLRADDMINDHAHQLASQLRSAGFVCGRNDAGMWTTPFALFASLFSVLGYASTDRYIDLDIDTQVQQSLREIRERAQGRRCIGIFWSSCESDDLYARKSLRHEHLELVWHAPDDIHWVVMQRGYERTCWINDTVSKDPQRFTTLSDQLSLAQTIGVLDHLDGFVGNDGVLAHAAGALNKPGYLLLNARCADWRYEQGMNITPWYSSLKVIRPDTMGDWDAVAAKLASAVKGFAHKQPE